MQRMEGEVADVARKERDPWTLLRLSIGWSVLVLWIVSIVLNSIPSAIDVAPDLTPLMTIVVGALFTPEVIGALRRRNGNGKGDTDA